MEEGKKKIRRKVTQACENCRRKRVKCTGEKPSCKTCEDLNLICHYQSVTKKRGPRSGYIEEIVNKRVKQEIEKALKDNSSLVSNIQKLAKDNPALFSHDFIEKYSSMKENNNNGNSITPNTTTNTNEICPILSDTTTEATSSSTLTPSTMTTINNPLMNTINPFSGQNSKDENAMAATAIKNNSNSGGNSMGQSHPIHQYSNVILKKLDPNAEFGNTLILSNDSLKKYNMLKIDYGLIKEYFLYAHSYCPILVEEAFMERIANKTILPGLLMAVYASVYMFRPQHNKEKSKKYIKMAYKHTLFYFDNPSIQATQTFALLSNCECGSNRSWVFLGVALRMAYILRLNNDNSQLSKVFCEEQKHTFWYIICKDMMISVVTGRSYRYELYQFIRSETAEEFLTSLSSNIYSTNLIMYITVSNLLQKVIKYVKKNGTSSNDLNRLECEIDFWFDNFDSELKLKKHTLKKEEISDTLSRIHLSILFSTIKIMLYRHKPTCLITHRKGNTKKLLHYNNLMINNSINPHSPDADIFLPGQKPEVIKSIYDLNDPSSYSDSETDKEVITSDVVLGLSYNILKNKRMNKNNGLNDIKNDNTNENENELKKFVDTIIENNKSNKGKEEMPELEHVNLCELNGNKCSDTFIANDVLYSVVKNDYSINIDYNVLKCETLDMSNIYIDNNAEQKLSGKFLKFSVVTFNNDIIPNSSLENPDDPNNYNSTNPNNNMERNPNEHNGANNKIVLYSDYHKNDNNNTTTPATTASPSISTTSTLSNTTSATTSSTFSTASSTNISNTFGSHSTTVNKNNNNSNNNSTIYQSMSSSQINTTTINHNNNNNNNNNNNIMDIMNHNPTTTTTPTPTNITTTNSNIVPTTILYNTIPNTPSSSSSHSDYNGDMNMNMNPQYKLSHAKTTNNYYNIKVEELDEQFHSDNSSSKEGQLDNKLNPNNFIPIDKLNESSDQEAKRLNFENFILNNHDSQEKSKYNDFFGEVGMPQPRKNGKGLKLKDRVKCNSYNKLLEEILNPTHFNCHRTEEYKMTEYVNIRNEDGKESFTLRNNNKKYLNSMNSLKKCKEIANEATSQIEILDDLLTKSSMKYHYTYCWCFYQIGIIYMIWYVNEGNEEDRRIAKFYERLIESMTKYFLAVTPFLCKYREMLEEADNSVKDGIRRLVIKDIL